MLIIIWVVKNEELDTAYLLDIIVHLGLFHFRWHGIPKHLRPIQILMLDFGLDKLLEC